MVFHTHTHIHTSTADARNARRARAHVGTNTHRPHTAAESTNNAAEKRIHFCLLNEVLSVAEEITTDSIDAKKTKKRKKITGRATQRRTRTVLLRPGVFMHRPSIIFVLPLLSS